ncbi:MAG TPA: hypothetical protein VGX26_08650 [Solirubrobacteraceae bacterium]|nr:hypothetical protein [Solirubrobacteraceae bacterium]
MFLRISQQVGEQISAKGVSESEVVDDFATSAVVADANVVL